MNLFIDTNIYLTFYHFTSDDLEELKKLSIAIENQKIKLYITKQVLNEYKRNREARISDALKKFTEQKLNNQFPQICKEYEEFNYLKEAIKVFNKNKDIIINKLLSDIAENKLGADEIISELIDKAKIIKITEKIYNKAKIRIDLGNPPGKKGSLGDALNWELLLDEIPNNEDLYLITDDRDFISKINEDSLSKFLSDEWFKKKNSSIYFYKQLSYFFNEKFPDIKLASELEKELTISNLINSSNFQNTHNSVNILSKFSDFSDYQIKELINASISNNQIYWISSDKDIKNFFISLISDKENIIDPDKLNIFKEKYCKEKDSEDNLEVSVAPF